MKNRIGILSILLVVFSFTTNAQNNLTLDQKSSMVRASYEVKLAPEVINVAEEYAAKNNYEPKIIQKNFIHLKVIYNDELKRAERLKYCQYLLELWQHDKSSLPDGLIRLQQKNLQTKMISND